MSSVRDKLNEKIPRDVIATRKNGNMNLSYLEGWYVINRMNEILGQGNWSYEILELKRTMETSVENERTGRTGRGVAYICTVRLTASIDGKTASFTDVGAGKGIDYNFGLEADESASKEAVTDALKRCAKNLGMSMGLALYDKTQENVEEEPAPAPKKAAPAPTPKEAPKAAASSDASRNVIKQAAQVLNAKKTLSIAQFKEKFLAPLGAEKVDALTDEQASAVLATISKSFPELQLQ